MIRFKSLGDATRAALRAGASLTVDGRKINAGGVRAGQLSAAPAPPRAADSMESRLLAAIAATNDARFAQVFAAIEALRGGDARQEPAVDRDMLPGAGALLPMALDDADAVQQPEPEPESAPELAPEPAPTGALALAPPPEAVEVVGIAILNDEAGLMESMVIEVGGRSFDLTASRDGDGALIGMLGNDVVVEFVRNNGALSGAMVSRR